MKTTTPLTVWSSGKKFLFRYLFIFFGLIIFPFPLNVIPGISKLMQYYSQIWTALINVAGKTFFGITEPLADKITGSGDKLYDWLWYFCVIVLTVIIGTLFSVLDRKRMNYERLKSWFLLFLTYYLAYVLLSYGIIKLFYLQFGPPNLERLFQTFGQASPMRLVWTFMGYSETYTVFSGASETLAGVLLLFRRTRMLGALIAVGVMLNVFMLNMSYDVPVKLFSFQLMIIGIYLAAQERSRILAFFVLNKPVAAREDRPLLRSKRGKYILWGVQALFAGFIIYNDISNSFSSQERYGKNREKSPLYGVYNVDMFIRNKDTLPPLTTDTTRWKRVLFDYTTFTSVMLMDDNVKRYDSEIDTLAETIIFAPRGDTITKYKFKYFRTGKDFRMEGIVKEDTLNITMTYYDLKNFGLLNRGFHWINEVPYNRYNYD